MYGELLAARFSLFFNQNGRHVFRDAKPIEGGLTNRSFLVRTESNEYVARLPGEGSEQFIDREKESHDTDIAFKEGATPEVVYDERNGLKVTRFLKNPVPMTVELLKNEEYICQIAGVLKKLHSVEKPFANTVNVFDRNKTMLEILKLNNQLIPAEYIEVSEQMDVLEALFENYHFTTVPCHNDTTPGNFILSEGRMQMIDFEYAGNNDAVWDLACLSMEGEFTEEQDETLMRAYYGKDVDESVAMRFVLYKPVVEYWVGVWCMIQMMNNGCEDKREELRVLENKRFMKCREILNEDGFRYLFSHHNVVTNRAATVRERSPSLF